MTTLDPTILGFYESTLGTAAISSLADRKLLRSIDVPRFDAVEPQLVADRTHGAVFGLALGDSFATWIDGRRNDQPPTLGDISVWLARESRRANGARISGLTATFRFTAEAMLRDAGRAPADLARRFQQDRHELRATGRATGHAVRRLDQGAPWFEAASPSYGDAAMTRAVAVGLRLHMQPEWIGVTASLDTVVTHAARRAASSGAALAAIIAGLVARPEQVEPSEVVARVLPTIDHSRVRRAVEATLKGAGDFDGGFEPTAIDALRLALWSQQFGPDLASVLDAATRYSGGDRAALMITAALHGAAGGRQALPHRAWNVERGHELTLLADRLAAAQPIVTPGSTATSVSPTDPNAGADIWFLIDRSGSMDSIREFVVSGFDDFFTKQRAEAGDATVTVVQFDGEDPHDVIIDALSLDRVPSIRDRFEPRGMTPLYDAVGLLLDRAERRGGDDADQLVVILTDGGENASTTWNQHRLFGRITELRQRGWTFAFLGANQDSYDTGGMMAMPAGSVSNFGADEAGVHAVYSGLDRTVSEWRGKSRVVRRLDADHFWGGVKEAEQTR